MNRTVTVLYPEGGFTTYETGPGCEFEDITSNGVPTLRVTQTEQGVTAVQTFRGLPFFITEAKS